VRRDSASPEARGSMIRTVTIAAVATGASAFGVGGFARNVPTRAAAPVMDFYSFSGNTIDGKATSMADYKGKPVLILNVASL